MLNDSSFRAPRRARAASDASSPPPHVAHLRFDILTTFPELFGSGEGCVLNSSIPARAMMAGLVEWHATNIRGFTHDKHQKTDDRPFGGGPGMVMMCQPLWDAVQAVEAEAAEQFVAASEAGAVAPTPTRVLLTPQGRPLTQKTVEQLATRRHIVLIAGHYEGIDERVIQKLDPIEVSLGDYVLSGGELAAMVLMDAVIRLLPGALGDGESALQDSFSDVGLPARLIDGRKKGGSKVLARARLLDCPHYTRPREWMGMEVPEVLMSGDHKAVEAWRLAQRLERTRERRPDLLPEELRELGSVSTPGSPPNRGA